MAVKARKKIEKRGHLCVFAKPPKAGDVKTRLIPAIGADAAAALAGAFFRDTWAEVSRLPWAIAVAAVTDANLESLNLAEPPEIWLQGPGDLGARVERILRRALVIHGAPFAIAVGADSPGLPPRLLDRAHQLLKTADAVIGPCDDGGFYLLGVKRCPEGLLRDLPWSEAETCARTLERLRAAGLKTKILDPWFDVDMPRDMDRLRALLQRGEIHAPETALVLAEIPVAVTEHQGNAS